MGRRKSGTSGRPRVWVKVAAPPVPEQLKTYWSQVKVDKLESTCRKLWSLPCCGTCPPVDCESKYECTHERKLSVPTYSVQDNNAFKPPASITRTTQRKGHRRQHHLDRHDVHPDNCPRQCFQLHLHADCSLAATLRPCDCELRWQTTKPLHTRFAVGSATP